MTVISDLVYPRSVEYTVGSTPSAGPFNIPFPFFDDDTVTVYVDNTETADFSITKGSPFGTSGNTVTLDSSVSNANVTIQSATEIVRSTGVTFTQSELSQELDRLFAIFQEQAEEADETSALGRPGSGFIDFDAESVEDGDNGVVFFRKYTSPVLDAPEEIELILKEVYVFTGFTLSLLVDDGAGGFTEDHADNSTITAGFTDGVNADVNTSTNDVIRPLATETVSGRIVFSHIGGNNWVYTGVFGGGSKQGTISGEATLTKKLEKISLRAPASINGTGRIYTK